MPVLFRFAKKSAKRSIIIRAREHTAGGFDIPARPFLRGGIRSNLAKLSRVGREGLKSAARDLSTLRAGLDLLGVAAVGVVKHYMSGSNFVPNAPSTVKKKGSSQPTIADGQLRQSITHVVEGKV